MEGDAGASGLSPADSRVPSIVHSILLFYSAFQLNPGPIDVTSACPPYAVHKPEARSATFDWPARAGQKR